MTTTRDTDNATPIADATARKLRRYNGVMGALHALQAIAVLALATAFALPVTGSFLEGPPGTTPGDPEVLFELRTAWMIAAFFLLSAGAHALLTTPGINRWYNANLGRQRNYARWIEYSVSSSLMIVVIAQLVGIADIAALVAIFGVNVSMILFGLVQERYEQPGGSLLPFWLGCIAGVTPWIAIAIYTASPGNDTTTPGFVIAIVVSLFVFFNCFAVNQWLQYRQIGRWRNYVYGESAYILLSLVAKSLLAWQIFAGTLN
jgi:hypothetical protein